MRHTGHSRLLSPVCGSVTRMVNDPRRCGPVLDYAATERALSRMDSGTIDVRGRSVELVSLATFEGSRVAATIATIGRLSGVGNNFVYVD
jgi:hypothetical protein